MQVANPANHSTLSKQKNMFFQNNWVVYCRRREKYKMQCLGDSYQYHKLSCKVEAAVYGNTPLLKTNWKHNTAQFLAIASKYKNMEQGKWNPTGVEWETVCETKEQFELFCDFVKSMKNLKEGKITEFEQMERTAFKGGREQITKAYGHWVWPTFESYKNRK